MRTNLRCRVATPLNWMMMPTPLADFPTGDRPPPLRPKNKSLMTKELLEGKGHLDKGFLLSSKATGGNLVGGRKCSWQVLGCCVWVAGVRGPLSILSSDSS